jgi:hypothetical protein
MVSQHSSSKYNSSAESDNVYVSQGPSKKRGEEILGEEVIQDHQKRMVRKS